MASLLMTVDELAAPSHDDAIRVADTRWKLGAPGAGREMFEAGHIPGAIHLDMDRDLAAPPGAAGRHPLPSTADFAETMSRAGVGAATLVVAYDDGDAMGAPRLWWLLRHFGHERVALLDGGFRAWRAAGKPVEQGPGVRPQRQRFEAHPRAGDTVSAEDVQRGGIHLMDARAPERFRGEVEPVDPVPGRIPGSINAPAAENIRDFRFREPAVLRAYYDSLGILDGTPIVASCGSGVTACIDLFGLELAGIEGGRLYPGSYSEWLAKGLPVDKG